MRLWTGRVLSTVAVGSRAALDDGGSGDARKDGGQCADQLAELVATL